MKGDKESLFDSLKHLGMWAIILVVLIWFIKGLFGRYWYFFWGYLIITLLMYYNGIQ